MAANKSTKPKTKAKLRLKLIPITDGHWANPKEVDRAVVEVNRMAAEHKFKSIAIVGELQNGSVYTYASRSEDVYSVAAQFMMMAIRLMGFKEGAK